MSKTKKEIHKEYLIVNWLFFLIGVALLVVGIYKILFLEPTLAINARYLQQTVDNGSVMIIAGLAMIYAGVYRVIKKKKVLKDILDLEKEKN